MTTAQLEDRARQNVVAAQRDFAGKDVVIQGVVQQVTMVARRSVVASYDFGQMQAHEQHESLPLVVLAPGFVFCYFEPDRLNDAADLKPGDAAAFACTVATFRSDRGQIFPILRDCQKRR